MKFDFEIITEEKILCQGGTNPEYLRGHFHHKERIHLMKWSKEVIFSNLINKIGCELSQ